MIEVDCQWCGEGLEDPGAILTSPPGFFEGHEDADCAQFHLCMYCFSNLLDLMDGGVDDDGPDDEEHDLPVGPIKLLTGPRVPKQ